MTNSARIYNGGSIRFTRPIIGFVGLQVGNAYINNISYINPYVAYDVAQWLLTACRHEEPFATPLHPRCDSICLDCEGLGMAYLTLNDAETITVMREGTEDVPPIAYEDDISGHKQKLLEDFADSVEEYLDDFVEFECPEPEDQEKTKERLCKLITRLRNEALAYVDNQSPKELYERLCYVPVRDLTKDDIDMLVSLFKINMAKTRLSEHTTGAVMPTWYVSDVHQVYSPLPENRLIVARLSVSCNYFKDRQLAFLRKDGCVELAGWADGHTDRVIRQVFATWCEMVNRVHEKSIYNN